jgi:hypothetical protein
VSDPPCVVPPAEAWAVQTAVAIARAAPRSGSRHNSPVAWVGQYRWPIDLHDTHGLIASPVLRLGSKFNHSCEPNVGFSWQHHAEGGAAAAAPGGVGRGCFTALREIPVGEELNISYLTDEQLAMAERQRAVHLFAKPGMEWLAECGGCGCVRCVVDRSAATRGSDY